MDFAIVKIAGKQHLVKVGDKVDVEAPLGEVGKSLSFPEILLLQADDELKIGSPFVSGAVVKAVIETSGKGEKIRVSKFKSKVRYRKTIGFRPMLTQLKIISVSEKIKKADAKLPVRPRKRT